ncbi:hypothetical protein TNCV_3113131 [Trichonephila clavipes]|nr:hypothetical protein TNCV_3113131 [Trichonephila clavipes]
MLQDNSEQIYDVKGFFEKALEDGSSDETFLNGSSRVFMTTQSDTNYQRVIGAGAITSCFTYELRAIIEALDLFETPYSRTR